MELERFFRELVNAIREYDPSRLHQPHRLRDIQYGLVPYRSVRKTLELECSEDHEMLLLRLCAGEGGYFTLADADSCRAFSEEADGVNPDLGLLQVYGDIEVSLEAEAIDRSMMAPEEESVYRPPDVAPAQDRDDEPAEPDGDEEAEAVVITLQDTSPTSAESSPRAKWEVIEEAVVAPEPELEPEAEPEPDPEPEPEPSVEMPSSSSPTDDLAPDDDSSATEATTSAPPCAYCGGSLPATRQANFCPHCGEDLTIIRCAKCSEELEEGWRHCIACGHRVSDG